MRIVCFLVPIVLAASLATSGALSAALAPSMQAAVVSGSRIQLQQVPRPVPAAGEVLVKLQYASVNPADWKRASGRPEDPAIGAPRPGQPQIPGMDGAGTIEALGPGVTTFKVGDAVLLWSRHGGTYARFVSVAAKDVAKLPEGLDVAQAAALPHAGLAAWNMLVDLARVQPGQTVLVLGGAGGVGSAAVQIAAIRGAHVTATASARNAPFLQQIGAEHVIDYGSQHFEEQLRNVDVVVNAVDTDNAYRGLAVIKHGGYLVSVAGLPLPEQCAGRGVTCAARTVATTGTREALTHLAEWARSGRLKVNIDRTFELSAVLPAWAYSQAGHTRGKALIHVEDSK